MVEQDTKISSLLSLGFLLVCIVNMMALLLAKFTARDGDIAVRRELGASRWQIFQQFALKSFVIGCVGAVIGVALSFLALRLMANGNADMSAIYKMDAAMLSLTVSNNRPPPCIHTITGSLPCGCNVGVQTFKNKQSSFIDPGLPPFLSDKPGF